VRGVTGTAKQRWVAGAGVATGGVAVAWPFVARAVIAASVHPAGGGTWFGDGLFENMAGAVRALWILACFLVIGTVNAIPAAAVVVLGVRWVRAGIGTRVMWVGLLCAALAVGLTGYDWLALFLKWPLR